MNILRHPLEATVACVTMIAIVVVGYAFIAAQAATPFAYSDASNSTAVSPAQIVDDTSTASGKAIKFGPDVATQPDSSGKMLQPYGLGIAPYAYLPWSGSMNEVQTATGVKNFVAAFVISAGGSCTPAWDGDSSLGLSSARSTAIANDFAKIRGAGGDAMVSFGGASGTELAGACSDASKLKQAYRSVIDRYSLTKIDFDIEGANASNTTVNGRRADAIAALQKDLPGLRVWVTVAVEPNGLSAQDKGIVQQLRDKGVVLSGINIMVMDYGINSKQMGQTAISAAQGLFAQLKQLYPTSSDTEIWKGIGMTAMVGINDTEPETFTLANAKEVHDFAVQKGIGMLSYWNTERDKACANNAATLSDSCSGVSQTPYQFAKTLSIPATN